jgi:lysozyme
MTLPKPGTELIKEFEGLYLTAYPDPLTGNKPITIGYGSTRKLDGSEWKLGDKITEEEAEQLLEIQLKNNYLEVLEYEIPTWNKLNENQKGAVLSFGYNLGAYFYGNRGFRSITYLLDHPEFWTNEQEVTRVFSLYRNPGSNVEVGLLRRRQTEAKLFLTEIKEIE